MTKSAFEPLRPILQKIRNRTFAHEELRAAHHFMFALPRNANAAKKMEIAIIGINPGESAHDRRYSPGSGHEETFERDFHADAKVRSRASKRWLNHVDYFTDGAPSVLTEIFFWSSRDLNEFKGRFGELSKSPHLDFCKECNSELLGVLKPKLVIGAGLGMASTAEKIFGLEHIGVSVRCEATGHRLIDEYSDGLRPWLFTKHWSGSRGFTKAQKSAIQDYIRIMIGTY